MAMRTAATYPASGRSHRPQIGHAPQTMTLEVHATAAGAGHPPAGQPPGTLVTLAETIVIKEENVFVVSRRDGSLPVGAAHPLGFYSDDCRFLCGHELRVNGVRPRLLVASAAPGSESVHELTNPALPLPGGRVLPLQSIQLRLERRVAGDCELEETLLVHSYDREPLELELDLLLAADFEPMLAIRGIVAAGRGAGVTVERFRRGAALQRARPRRPPPRDDDHGRPRLRAGRRTRGRSASRSRWRREASRRSRCATCCTRATSRPRDRRRAAGGCGAPAARRRPGWRSAPWSRPTTSCSTACCGARCSTCGCCTRGSAPTATTPPGCRGTRRCSGATR